MNSSKFPKKGNGGKVQPMSDRTPGVKADPKHPLGPMKPADATGSDKATQKAPKPE
jgi:hypothetical protein